MASEGDTIDVEDLASKEVVIISAVGASRGREVEGHTFGGEWTGGPRSPRIASHAHDARRCGRSSDDRGRLLWHVDEGTSERSRPTIFRIFNLRTCELYKLSNTFIFKRSTDN